MSELHETWTQNKDGITLKKKRDKLTNRDIEKQLNYLFQMTYEIRTGLQTVRTLLENYILFKKDIKQFTKHLQNEAEKRESEARKTEPSKGS